MYVCIQVVVVVIVFVFMMLDLSESFSIADSVSGHPWVFLPAH